MRFFLQAVRSSCNVVALQHALSFFSLCPSFDEIRRELPAHSFGSWITEMGVFLEEKGFRTVLYANKNEVNCFKSPFLRSLENYRKIGTFVERAPVVDDLKDKPVIVNVDARKVRGEQGRPVPHYVVLMRKGQVFWLYDGAHFSESQQYKFEEVYAMSLDINRFHENGMWLVLL